MARGMCGCCIRAGGSAGDALTALRRQKAAIQSSLMSTLAEIEAAAGALSVEDKSKLLASLASQLQSALLSASGAGRSPGLHEGVWEVAADFDAPLPDEFWMGG